MQKSVSLALIVGMLSSAVSSVGFAENVESEEQKRDVALQKNSESLRQRIQPFKFCGESFSKMVGDGTLLSVALVTFLFKLTKGILNLEKTQEHKNSVNTQEEEPTNKFRNVKGFSGKTLNIDGSKNLVVDDENFKTLDNIKKSGNNDISNVDNLNNKKTDINSDESAINTSDIKNLNGKTLYSKYFWEMACCSLIVLLLLCKFLKFCENKRQEKKRKYYNFIFSDNCFLIKKYIKLKDNQLKTVKENIQETLKKMVSNVGQETRKRIAEMLLEDENVINVGSSAVSFVGLIFENLLKKAVLINELVQLVREIRCYTLYKDVITNIKQLTTDKSAVKALVKQKVPAKLKDKTIESRLANMILDENFKIDNVKAIVKSVSVLIGDKRLPISEGEFYLKEVRKECIENSDFVEKYLNLTNKVAVEKAYNEAKSQVGKLSEDILFLDCCELIEKKMDEIYPKITFSGSNVKLMSSYFLNKIVLDFELGDIESISFKIKNFKFDPTSGLFSNPKVELEIFDLRANIEGTCPNFLLASGVLKYSFSLNNKLEKKVLEIIADSLKNYVPFIIEDVAPVFTENPFFHGMGQEKNEKTGADNEISMQKN